MSKVLIVENDRAVRDVLAYSMTKEGHEILLAENGAQALTFVDQADVVLLDLYLPKLSGEDFLRMIRESGNYIPVIVTSGVYSKADVEKRLQGLSIVEFVPKPFSIVEVIEKVAKGLETSKNMSVIPRSTDRIQGFIARQAAASSSKAKA